MCLIHFFKYKNWYLQTLFYVLNTNSQILMSIYLTLFSVGHFSFIETIIWLLLDCRLNFTEIHIFWELIEADFVFNGHFFQQVKKKNQRQKTTSDNNWLLSQLKRLISIFFYQTFETTDWVSQLDPVSSDAINSVIKLLWCIFI